MVRQAGEGRGQGGMCVVSLSVLCSPQAHSDLQTLKKKKKKKKKTPPAEQCIFRLVVNQPAQKAELSCTLQLAISAVIGNKATKTAHRNYC